MRRQEIISKKLAEKAVIWPYHRVRKVFQCGDLKRGDKEAAAKSDNKPHLQHMGEAYPREQVRAAMLLRCNAWPEVIAKIIDFKTLIDMLNRGVHPVVPQKGSCYASIGSASVHIKKVQKVKPNIREVITPAMEKAG